MMKRTMTVMHVLLAEYKQELAAGWFMLILFSVFGPLEGDC